MKSFVTSQAKEKFVDPIEKIQSVTFDINKTHNDLFNYLEENRENHSKPDLLNEFKSFLSKIQKFNIKIETLNRKYLHKLFNLRDKFTNEIQREKFRIIEEANLTKEKLKTIGNYLIENRFISRTISEISVNKSIGLADWLEIIESLKRNSIFVQSILNLKNYSASLYQKKLELELEKIPQGTRKDLIEKFKKQFLNKEVSNFTEFMVVHNRELSKDEIKEKQKIIEKARSQEKIELLKKRQAQEQLSYNEYFELSQEEFERRRRKRKREKLSEIVKDEDKVSKLEIPEEISEKIEKFKSKIDHTFEKDYLVSEDDNLDPLDLIRTRKEKKKKEYREHIKKFENKD